MITSLLPRLIVAIFALIAFSCKTDLGDRFPSSSSSTDASAAGDDGLVPQVDGSVSPEGGADTDVEGALRLLHSEPANGDTGVAPDAHLVLTFSAPILPRAGAIRLIDALSSSVVEEVLVGDARVQLDASEVRVDWTTALAAATQYYVTIDPGALTTLDGAAYAGIVDASALSFSTRSATDLQLVSSTPAHEATGVSISPVLELEFNQHVHAGVAGNISILQLATDEPVLTIASADASLVSYAGAVVAITLPASLQYLTDYYVTIEPGAIQSLEGAPYAGLLGRAGLSFSTGAPPELELVATAPADNSRSVDPNTSIIFTFNEPVLAGTGSIAVHRSEDDSVVVSIPALDPAVLISEVYVTVDLPTALDNSTAYYVTLDAAAVVSERGAAFAGISGRTAFSFTTAEVPPEPLLLESTSPLSGATAVAVDTTIRFVFNQDVRLGAGNIVLLETESSEVFETIPVTDSQVSLTRGTVTVRLEGVLASNTGYSVQLSAGTFESLQGASFVGLTDEFSFTTEDALALESLSPTHAATAVSDSTDLILTFTTHVEAGEGNLSIYASEGDVLIESVPLNDARVAITDNVVRVNLDNLLAGSTSFYVLLDSSAIVDLSGTPFGGLSAQDDWSFTTEAATFPGDVSTGLVLWLDASYAPSVKDDAGVSLWVDRSQRYNNLRQATGSARPTRVEAALGERDVIRFDGVDDGLVAAAGFDLSAFEGFVVWSSPMAPSTTKGNLLINGRNFEVNHGHPSSPAALSVCTGATCADDTGWSSQPFVPGPITSAPTLWNFGFDATTTSLFTRAQGGAAVFNTGPTLSPTLALTPFGVGNEPAACGEEGCPFQGDVAEILLYSRQLSAAERAAVTSALRAKWELPEPSCAASEVRGPSGACYLFSTTATTWDAARSACIARGTGWDLASVRSAEDHEFIAEQLTTDSWLGASDTAVEGTWRWVNDTLQFWTGTLDGSATGGAYVIWGSDEPTSGTMYNCARYHLYTDTWRWADTSCGLSYGSVCEGPGQ